MVLLVAIVVRLPNLNDSLWFDEVVYTGVGLQGESLRWILFHDVHPPLYALVPDPVGLPNPDPTADELSTRPDDPVSTSTGTRGPPLTDM